MRFFKTKDQKSWERFLRTASEEQLTEARNHYRSERIRANEKCREIQREVDKRIAENPPERGQVIRVGN